MKSKKLNLTAAALAASIATGASFAAPETAQAEVAYNIGVHSKYLLRGIGEESTGAAVQGGVDWSNDAGAYFGYWFSSLSYNSANTNSQVALQGWENDLYGGYSGKINEDMSWDIGLIQYVYINVDDSDLTELTGTFNFKDFYVGLQYLLNDGAWGNSGDIYWKAGWSTSISGDIGLALDLGFYTYDDSDNSDLSIPTGFTGTTSSSGFRHLNVVASKEVMKNVEAYLQYTFAGEDRFERDYDDSMVAGITYSF